MHRRSRHINAAAAGSSCVLDTRFIKGLSDGNGISSWSDRNLSTNNSPVQATANNQPLYSTNIQGGNPAALFNNSSSAAGRFLTYSTTPLSGATSASAIYCFRRTGINASTPGAILTNFGSEFLEDHEPYSDNNAYLSFASTARKSFLLTTAVPNNADTINYISSQSNSWKYIVNNSLLYSTTTNTVGIGTSARIGASNSVRPNGAAGGAYFWTGYVYSIMTFKFILSDSLRKRLQHSMAFSFKIKNN